MAVPWALESMHLRRGKTTERPGSATDTQNIASKRHQRPFSPAHDSTKVLKPITRSSTEDPQNLDLKPLQQCETSLPRPHQRC
ncbi:hypothetical protein J3R74_003049 [Puniceicoccus vermicola]